MNRRTFLQRCAGAALITSSRLEAALPKAKITRIRYYKAPTDAAGRPNTRQPTFNQSSNIVTVETDIGVTGIGEGGSDDTMEQCAGMLIGEDPFRIEYLWQVLYRGYFYPAGREKVHALGALDVALWDIKGKALGAPVYQLLGGLSREHCGMLLHRVAGSRHSSGKSQSMRGKRLSRLPYLDRQFLARCGPL